jgi:hypothetical protein
MDRFNWLYHYNNPAYQEDGQHTFQPETGQTSSGVAESGAPWSYPVPGQSYPDFNVQPQIPPSPGPDWESFLRTPQPMAMEDIFHSQVQQQDGQYSFHQQEGQYSFHQQEGQYSFQPETGQTSAGGAASEPWWSQPTPGQLQPYQDFNIPVQVPPSLGSDWEYIQSPQPMVLDDTIQDDASLAPSNPQPAAAPHRRKAPMGLPPAKERFLAGLEAFAQGDALKDCSSSIRFSNYIKDDGSLTNTRGINLYSQFTDAEKELLNQAIIDRQAARLPTNKAPVEERFLAGLDNYARGVPLVNCSATLSFKLYATDSGYLHPDGKEVRSRLSSRDQQRVDDALLSRRLFHLKRTMENDSVDDRFLAGLDNYAQGVPLANCSTTIQFGHYISDDGTLHHEGLVLYKRLLPVDQERVNDALLSRRQCLLNRAMETPSVEERFLAGLDNYERGVPLINCSATLKFNIYVTSDGTMHPAARVFYSNLSPQDRNRVDQALATRRRMAAERISADLPNFMDALEPYSNGLDLNKCGKQSSLQRREGRYRAVERYLTPEGGLTAKGELLIENLPLKEQLEVKVKVEQRRQLINPGAQVPEIPASMPEIGGMDPTPPMQTEAMMTAAWQYTGQAMPGTWGIPSESAGSSIPSYGRDVVGTNFQHRYDSYGLIPQRAPDRLIGWGIVHGTLINVLGEVYRVYDTGRRSVNPTNENPQGSIIMLVPRMQGG